MTPDRNLPPLIGITGKAGSGKSTAAAWFTRNHVQCYRMSFARPLKRMLYELLREALPAKHRWSPTDYLESPEMKDVPIDALSGLTARHLMQTLGTEWGRKAAHPHLWLDILRGKVERTLGTELKAAAAPRIKIVIDDVRFADEAALVRDYGGIILRLDRPGAGESAAGHESEAMDFKADLTHVNTGSIDDLYAFLAKQWPPTVQPKNKA